MKKSSGLIIYRKKNSKIEVLLVHPGGPYWQNKDENSWSIPKGEVTRTNTNLERINANNISSQKFASENEVRIGSRLSSQEFALLKNTAIREFEEETGLKLDEEDKKKIHYLGEVKSSNKILYIFVLEKDFGDDFEIKSNLIEIEWPPRSGKIIKVPEVNKASYFDLKIARQKLVNYQKEIVDKLIDKLLKSMVK